MDKPLKYGLVLSGGGARGFAHLGVLKALQEKGIQPDAISAVSAGALIAVFIADGFTPDEILEIFSKLKLYRAVSFREPNLGFLKATGIQRLMEKHLRHKNIEDLTIPVYISATNFIKSRTDYFSSGPIIQAVMASSAIPLIFKPYSINNELYVDGGLMNNLPVEPLIDNTEFIIGVNVNSFNEINRILNIRGYIDRIIHLAIRANVKNNIERCDWYLEPPNLMKFNLFKSSSSKEIYQAGYDYTINFLKKY